MNSRRDERSGGGGKPCESEHPSHEGTNAGQKANTSQGHRTRVTDNHIGCQQETQILYTHKFGN